MLPCGRAPHPADAWQPLDLRARAGLGRLAYVGDRLPCARGDGLSSREFFCRPPPCHADGPIRAMPGPQLDRFGAAALETFLSRTFVVTRERDRMARLDGPRLAHVEGGADIVSDGVAPGAIQVPADWRPICCWPIVDGGRLSENRRCHPAPICPVWPICKTGDGLGFAFVDAAQAAAARAARHDNWPIGWPRCSLGGIDEASLLSANLAGAAVRGDEA